MERLVAETEGRVSDEERAIKAMESPPLVAPPRPPTSTR